MRAGQVTRLWTQGEISTVQHLYAIGAPVKWIAARIGRHPQATKSRIRDDGFKRDRSRYHEYPPLIALPDETWRRIEAAPNYFVSSIGRVLNMGERPGLIMKQEVDKDGYRRVTLCVTRNRPKHFLVSRLVLTGFVGPAPSPEYHAAHNDGTTDNNTVGNLRWATPADNIADKKVHGTWQIGERHPRATATTDDAIGVKRMIAEARRAPSGRLRRGEAVRIAAEAGVSIHLVSTISSAKGWQHV